MPRAHRYDTLTIDADYPLFAGAGEAEAKQRAVDVRFERANDAKVLRALFLFDAPCRLQRYTLAVFGPTP